VPLTVRQGSVDNQDATLTYLHLIPRLASQSSLYGRQQRVQHRHLLLLLLRPDHRHLLCAARQCLQLLLQLVLHRARQCLQQQLLLWAAPLCVQPLEVELQLLEVEVARYLLGPSSTASAHSPSCYAAFS
jgi:hypothetical protein